MGGGNDCAIGFAWQQLFLAVIFIRCVAERFSRHHPTAYTNPLCDGSVGSNKSCVFFPGKTHFRDTCIAVGLTNATGKMRKRVSFLWRFLPICNSEISAFSYLVRYQSCLLFQCPPKMGSRTKPCYSANLFNCLISWQKIFYSSLTFHFQFVIIWRTSSYFERLIKIGFTHQANSCDLGYRAVQMIRHIFFGLLNNCIFPWIPLISLHQSQDLSHHIIKMWKRFAAHWCSLDWYMHNQWFESFIAVNTLQRKIQVLPRLNV